MTHPDDDLPAFVNGTLPARERDAIQSHLASCVQCREEVDWLATLREQMQNDPLPAVNEMGMARLMKAVRAEEKQIGLSAPGWMRGALAAAVLVMVAQFGVIAVQWQPQTVYRPLGETVQGPRIQVRFAAEASEAQIRALLDSIDGQIVAGPSALGLYHVALPEGETVDAIERAAATLQAADGIVEQAMVESAQ